MNKEQATAQLERMLFEPSGAQAARRILEMFKAGLTDEVFDEFVEMSTPHEGGVMFVVEVVCTFPYPRHLHPDKNLQPTYDLTLSVSQDGLWCHVQPFSKNEDMPPPQHLVRMDPCEDINSEADQELQSKAVKWICQRATDTAYFNKHLGKDFQGRPFGSKFGQPIELDKNKPTLEEVYHVLVDHMDPRNTLFPPPENVPAEETMRSYVVHNGGHALDGQYGPELQRFFEKHQEFTRYWP